MPVTRDFLGGVEEHMASLLDCVGLLACGSLEANT